MMWLSSKLNLIYKMPFKQTFGQVVLHKLHSEP